MSTTLTLRKANDRGHANHGWLDSRFSFSFAEYHDPNHMGFSLLRVINDDHIAAGSGFGAHPHRDMEIVTYVLRGAVTHTDSMGNAEILRAGEVQRMSAGSGVTHSEANSSETDALHLLQIWLFPGQLGIAPGYAQKAFPKADRYGQLVPVVTPTGRDGSLDIHTDASLSLAALRAGEAVKVEVPAGRRAYVHVATGSIRLDGELLEAGDAAQVTTAGTLTLTTDSEGEVLVFDLP